MKKMIRNFGLSVISGGVFLAALVLFTAAPVSAHDDDDYYGNNGRPTEQWVRQRGYENGVRLGGREGAQDRLQGQRSDYKNSTYDYGLTGFNRQWVHDDNYKRGFRDGYRDGYRTGYDNPRGYVRDVRDRDRDGYPDRGYGRNGNRGRGYGRDRSCERDDDYVYRNRRRY